MYNVVVYGKDIKINGNHGTAGQVLTSDGVEGMSWTDVSGGGGSNPSLQQVLDVGNISLHTPIILTNPIDDFTTQITDNMILLSQPGMITNIYPSGIEIVSADSTLLLTTEQGYIHNYYTDASGTYSNLLQNFNPTALTNTTPDHSLILTEKGLSLDGAYGTVGQVLTADGAEGMSWSDVSGGGTTILPYSRVAPLTPQTSVLSADSSGNIYDLGDAFYIRNFGASVGLFATGSLDLLDGYGGSTTLNTYALDFGTDGQFSCRLSQDGGLRMTSSYNECLATYSASSIDMNFQNNNVVKLSSVANNQANAGLFLTRVATGLGAYYTDIGVQLGVVPDTGIYTTTLTKEYLKVDKIKDASSH
jgi:hypothetical protein